MTYAMVHQPASNNAQSPFRVIVQKTGRQVDWIARYLDQSCVRGLARHTEFAIWRGAADLVFTPVRPVVSFPKLKTNN